MKIPTFQPMQVAPAPARAPAAGVVRPDGFGALKQSLNELGRAVGGGASEATAAYEKQKHQAEVLEANNAQTELQRAKSEEFLGANEQSPSDPNAPVPDITKMSEEGFASFLSGEPGKRTPGFLSTKGEYSLPAMDETLKRLEERRQEIAKKLRSETSRKLFLQQSEPFMAHADGEARGHVARELERAKVDGVKNSFAQTLKDVSASPEDDELANMLVAGTAGRAAALASSDEDAEAKVTAIRGEVAMTRARVLLEQENLDKAEEVVLQSQAAIGAPAEKLLGLIAAKREAGAMNELAQSIVNTARSEEDGRINEASAWKGVAGLDGETQKKLSPVLTQYLAHERKAYDEATEKITNTAASEFLRLQNVAGPRAWTAFAASELGETLRVRNWKVYNQLQNGVESDLAREERKSRIRLNDAGARREQAETDKIIQNRWETTVRRNPDASLDTFMATEGQGGSRWMRSELEKDQVVTQQIRDKGLLTKQTEFVDRAMKAAENRLPPLVGNTQQRLRAKAAREKFEAEAGRAYARVALEEKEGADLTEKEAAGIIADIVTKLPIPGDGDEGEREREEALAEDVPAIIKRAGGHGGFQVMPELDVEAEAKNAGVKTLKGYRFNSSRTKRQPAYTDGTFGPSEDVPRGR